MLSMGMFYVNVASSSYTHRPAHASSLFEERRRIHDSIKKACTTQMFDSLEAKCCIIPQLLFNELVAPLA